MAETEHETARRDLRREVAGTIGLLADEEDFAAMRRYRTFTFGDHQAYLRQAEGLLRTLASQGRHTAVALFDPEEYAEFCAESGLEPDTPDSRTRFTAELASTGTTVPYEGQPLAELLPDLIDEAVRQATWEYATTLLARIGDCAICGEDIGRAAFRRASHLVTRAIETPGPGPRHLVCSVPSGPETLLAALHVGCDSEGNPQVDETETLEFTTVLAVAIATHSSAGLVMRTSADGTPDHVQGWRLHGERLLPLTAAEVFDAYCTHAVSGELIAPEPGIEYRPAPVLDDSEPEDGHQH
ncbi:hypothetical protein [Streptomyces sp. MZ04]|uniref:hypothetical protein n=1 Tax=Streptomyces sp. MZ04 TaxID=2559236 RepID=UPI00107E7850|nr:hypothetical protein [Streptomyces sp. MZ04]TGB15551.1 hypothetical protein E2651_02450 [Streptomyces sp. MZ04]